MMPGCRLAHSNILADFFLRRALIFFHIIEYLPPYGTINEYISRLLLKLTRRIKGDIILSFHGFY
jgi:hypothetical protein